jgi:hypothetical protein
MRPLFAIAPLALILSLIGQAPIDARQAVDALQTPTLGFKSAEHKSSAADTRRSNTLSSLPGPSVIQASLRP